LLLNGKVFVIGGITESNAPRQNGANDFVVINSCELYDPILEKWIISGAMHFPRTEHAASVLPNGEVLVTGGLAQGEPVIQTAELYHPSTGTWTMIENMPDCRSDHTSTTLLDGKVLVVGGNCDRINKNTADLYDPSTKRWTATGTLHYGRSFHTASILRNGKVLVIGGLIGDYNATSTAELYDPSTGNWTLANSMYYRRSDHTTSVLPNGKVLVTGGATGTTTLKDTEVYDPITGVWTITGDLNHNRMSHTASVLPNGKVLVTGGMLHDEEGPLTNTTELYDPSTGKWIIAGHMHFTRCDHTATVLNDGNVLVTGGIRELPPYSLRQSELYNSSTKTWKLNDK
jgi:calcineurin-like phosphoesterase family protein